MSVLDNLTDLTALFVVTLMVVTVFIVLALDKAANRIRVVKAKKQVKKEHSKIWRAM
jgi:hypothetical protein